MESQSKKDIPQDCFSFLFYGIFAIFFSQFIGDEKRTDDCTEKDFIDWCKITKIACLTIVIFIVVKAIGSICCHNEHRTLISAIKCFESIGIIFAVCCSFGLFSSDGQTCGDLHVVAKVYYIIIFISLSLAVLGLCCFCSIFVIARQLKPPAQENQGYENFQQNNLYHSNL